MTQQDDELRISRIGALTIVNAMIFQSVLAARNPRVTPLATAARTVDVAGSLLGAWDVILQIDYVPIFQLAKDILQNLSGNPGLDDALRALAEAAMRITSKRAALRHDLMGRIYHRLLSDGKYFGAFYTSIPAADLLLRLTLERDQWNLDWADLEKVKDLRIADFACGTGTLLKSALQTVAENHIRARAEAGRLPEVDSLHQALVENSIWGFDVIPFAIHLAAAALALHDPNVTFGAMNLRTMPLGIGHPPRLGSLDFLDDHNAAAQADLLGELRGVRRITGAGERAGEVSIPQMDLCVMNPPFTRSVGGNLLFGNLPRRERTVLRGRLQQVIQRKDVPASITAGLATAFAAIGHDFVKPGGHLALVVPRALISGIAWGVTRRLLAENYHVRYVLVSHEPGAWNFSESTSLSECLVVARRLKSGERPGPTKIVNLWRKPRTGVEAMTVADLVRASTGADLAAPSGTDELVTRERKYGEVVLVPPQRIEALDWGLPAAFAKTDLARAADHLLACGAVFAPGRGVVGHVPMTTVDTLATIGPDRRDIHDGFRLSKGRTPYAAFWGHNTQDVVHLRQDPNQYLGALPLPKPGRPLRDAALLWSRSGRLLVTERIRLTTARVISVHLDDFVLSNTWWPIRVKDDSEDAAATMEKALAVWMNSTLGVLSITAARVDTEGAWVEVKKPILQGLRVLDLRVLRSETREELAKIFDDMAGREFLPLPQLHEDPARAELDARLCRALAIQTELSELRHLLAADPLFSGSLDG